MSWDKYVIDASMGVRDGLFCFCPIEGDIECEFTIITGFNCIDEDPPRGKELVAIWHEDGQEAVERFCVEFEYELEAMKQRMVSG